jgi:hypothetical protein
VWNSSALPTAYVSATQLSAAVTASLVATSGAAVVSVQNPGGATSAGSSFTIGAFPLSITTPTTAYLPDGIIGSVYTATTFVAAGGVPPVTWTMTAMSGTIPPGLSLDPNSGILSGTVGGTPTTPNAATLQITATDSTQRSVSRIYSLLTAAPLTITTANPLPSASAGAPYPLTFAATGGTGTLTWSEPSPPSGLGLVINAQGSVSGTPANPGAYDFNIDVADSRSQTTTKAFDLKVAVPFLNISFLPNTSAPAQTPTVNVSLGGPYQVALSGALNLSFAPNSGAGDPAIQFSTGGAQATYTLPVGATTPVFSSALTLSTGTVAGTISITATASSATGDVTPPQLAPTTITIPPSAPAITNLTLSQVTGGVSVGITGYSTTREVQSATIQFNPASGSTLTAPPLTMNVASLLSAWYDSAAAAAYGSRFVLSLPFAVSGNVAAIGSVTVTLTNNQGTSPAVTATLQ